MNLRIMDAVHRLTNQGDGFPQRVFDGPGAFLLIFRIRLSKYRSIQFYWEIIDINCDSMVEKSFTVELRVNVLLIRQKLKF